MKNYYHLFDTLLEPTFILTAEGKVSYCNEPAAIICEHSVRKMSRGMLFKDLFTFSEAIEGLDDLNQIKDPTPYKEVNFETPAGKTGKIQVTIQPIKNEQHWILYVRDVTLEERLQKKYRAELEQKEDVILDLQKAQAELEQYSKNLEKMVEERTRQISNLNLQMKALLDSLSQGFFIFNNMGKVLEVSSRACETTIENRPAGKMIWDVLKLDERKRDGFKKWMSTLFSEMLPFEDLAPLGPESFPHSKGRRISLEYFPLRGEKNTVDGVVVVATDITSLVEARKQAENEKHYAKLIINLVRNKNEMGRFIRESQVILKDLHQTLSASQSNWDPETIFRCLHTLKGGAALFSVHTIAETCHHAETRLTKYNENNTDINMNLLKSQCQAVELQFNKFLSETKDILGSSILSQDRLLEVSSLEINNLFEKLSGLPQAKAIAEDIFGHLLFEPVKNFFEPYKNVSFRLAESENKILRNIEFKNEMIPVVPEIYGPLFATFVHAFRNAVDHGIETPEARHKVGKSEGGEILVEFERQDLPTPKLKISLRDDGGGIDPQKIRAKLEAKGFDTGKESDSEIIQHIFDSQFTTKETITQISGRGVGMDAIKHEAQQLGGRAWVESILGKGSTLIVEVPYLTKAPAKKAA
jgi:two-component system chemotaxis sensor kinase CheA